MQIGDGDANERHK